MNLVDWTRTVEPASSPVTVAEAKLHCRVDIDNDDDAFEDIFIPAATRTVEEYLSAGLFTQTWQLAADDWADEIPLPRAKKLQSITAVQYYAADGTLTTLSTSIYGTLTTGEPAVLVRKPNQAFPSLQSDRRARVLVTYVVGWSDVAAVPAWAKTAILEIVRLRYSGQQAWNGDIEAMLAPHRVWLKPVACA